MTPCIDGGTPNWVSKVNRKALGVTDPKVYVCHHCDNRRCVNPEHIYVGDATTNARDAAARKRWTRMQRETCLYGHPMDGRRTNAGGPPRRYCLTCNRERTAAWRARVSA